MIFLRVLLVAIFWPAFAAALSVEVDGVGITTKIVAEDVGEPVFLTAPRGDKRLFVVDRSGKILILSDGGVQERPFLDIGELVSTRGAEQGLLGLAFHPDYAENGRFFVNYTDVNGDTQIIAYQVSTDADVALATSATTLLTIEKRHANHNGGWIAFGPDNYLYIATGDGGGGGDPERNGQNVDALLGKILRIDVDGAKPYAIPPTNPFAKGGGAPEVFLYGVRNAWRNAFDGDNLYIADVGQNQFEEISVVTIADAGANLGWSIMEGMHCFRPRRDCDQTNLVLPVYEYPHSEGCSVTGGYVYRGKAIPEIAGRYFFGDYCIGTLLSFRYAGGAAGDAVNLGTQLSGSRVINSFGIDDDGEFYLLFGDGTIEKIVRAPP
jgi:glucose/arabinose dehydrogenase